MSVVASNVINLIVHETYCTLTCKLQRVWKTFQCYIFPAKVYHNQLIMEIKAHIAISPNMVCSKVYVPHNINYAGSIPLSGC